MKKSTLFILITILLAVVTSVTISYKIYSEVTYTFRFGKKVITEQLDAGSIHTIAVKNTDKKILIARSDSTIMAIFGAVKNKDAFNIENNTLYITNPDFEYNHFLVDLDMKIDKGNSVRDSTLRSYDVIICSPGIDSVITENAPNVTFKKENHGF